MTPDDPALVAAFLEAVAHMTQSEVGRRVPGISQSDVSRWQNEPVHRLTGPKRRAVLRYLKRRPGDPDPAQLEREALIAAAEALEKQAGELRRRAAKLNGRPGA